MPFYTINFSDVDSFEPMPGNEWYGVEIDKVEVRENKDGDALYLNWELVVVDGDYENRRLWMISSLKDSARRRLMQTFQELGVLDERDSEIEIEYDDDMEPTTKSGPRLLYPEVEGLEASVYVKNEMYDGTERNKVTEMRSEAPRKNHRGDDDRRSKRSKRQDADDDEPTRTVSRSRSRRDEDDDAYDELQRRRRWDEEDDDVEERPARRRTTERSGGRRRRVR